MEEIKNQIDMLEDDEDERLLVAPINQLPEEILERIFSFTSQYNDYINIGLVCKKWHRIIVGLIELNKNSFASCFQTGEIEWHCYEASTVSNGNTTSDSNSSSGIRGGANINSNNQDQNTTSYQVYPQHRHSHSCAILGGHSLYVFGGLSATSTAYNDLWSLDLNTKHWTRPATSGSYPSPKAAATLLARDSTRELILFGGYSHPYTYSFSQHVNFFDEFHVFSVRSSAWQAHVFAQDAPKLAGHSASFIRNFMILFGGCNTTLGNKSNSVYCLDLDTYTWLSVNSNSNSNQNSNPYVQQPSSYWRSIDGLRPEARYGHSQITLDEERILIVGGVGGPNKQFDDAWILHWPVDASMNARWERVLVRNVINAPSQPYCIPFVQCCGDKLVTFGKARMHTSNSSSLVAAATGENHAQSNEESSTPMTIHGTVKQIRPRVCSCSTSAPPPPPSPSSSSQKSLQEIKPKTTTNLPPKVLNETTAAMSKINHVNGGTNSVNNSNGVSSVALGIGVGAASGGVILNKSQLNTLKRHEVLKKLADKYSHPSARDRTDTEYRSTLERQLSSRRCLVHSRLMQVFVLDISKCIERPLNNVVVVDDMDKEEPLSVSWQTPIAHFTNAPSETTLYSLALGIDEIILFGGMELDSTMPYNMRPASSYEHIKHRVSNKVFVMKPRQLFNTRAYSTTTTTMTTNNTTNTSFTAATAV